MVVAVSAADAREELEAAIWRLPGASRPRDREDVDAILAAADAYASANAAEVLNAAARASRMRADGARGAARLERATAERTGRTT